MPLRSLISSFVKFKYLHHSDEIILFVTVKLKSGWIKPS
jgi:hypothetical protein